MYDTTELDLWVSDASISGDERKIADIPQDTVKNIRTRKKR